MYNAYINLGFGFLKALSTVDSQDRKVLQPSLYSEMTSYTSDNEDGIESDFGSYLFGESAVNVSSMVNRFQNYDDCLDDAYAAYCLYAISKMNGGNKIDCELVTALPYQSIRNGLDRKVMTKLAGTHTIKRLGYHKQTIEINFPAKYGVMPENIAPAFVHLAPNGKFKTDANGLIWIGVINVGSKTLELGTFGIDIDDLRLKASNQQMTFAKGTYTLADTVRQPLLDYLVGKRNSLSQHEIFRALVIGTVQYGNQAVNVSEIIGGSKSAYLDTVHRHCLENWTVNRGKEPGEIYQFVISGGGAYLISGYLEQVGFHNNIVISNEPQFDVCYGSRNWHRLVG